MMDNFFFIHSQCCDAHWELIYDAASGLYALQCEKCAKPAGSGITISGPLLAGRCARCNPDENAAQGKPAGEES